MPWVVRAEIVLALLMPPDMAAFTARMPLSDAVIEPELTMAPPIEALLMVMPVCAVRRRRSR